MHQTITPLEDNSEWRLWDVLIIIIIIMCNHIDSLRITISRWLNNKSLVLGKSMLQGSLQLSLQLDWMRLSKLLLCSILRTSWPVLFHDFPTTYINLCPRNLLTFLWNNILHDHFYSCRNSFYWIQVLFTRPVWWAGTTWAARMKFNTIKNKGRPVKGLSETQIMTRFQHSATEIGKNVFFIFWGHKLYFFFPTAW